MEKNLNFVIYVKKGVKNEPKNVKICYHKHFYCTTKKMSDSTGVLGQLSCTPGKKIEKAEFFRRGRLKLSYS